MVRLTFEMNTVALRKDEEETKRSGVEANRILGESRIVGEVHIDDVAWEDANHRPSLVKSGIEKFLQDWQDPEFIQAEAKKIADGEIAAQHRIA